MARYEAHGLEGLVDRSHGSAARSGDSFDHAT
ncbi:hypothetical protein [Mycobacterium sp. VKM Ac-1816D]|nr:hypothetical protein [Mycobacterium sp. VKM Ac-1816D]